MRTNDLIKIKSKYQVIVSSQCLGHLRADNRDVLNTVYLNRGLFRQDCVDV